LSALAFSAYTTGDMGTWYLDDVSVDAVVSTLPEPAGIFVFLPVVVMLGYRRLRRVATP
jgi:hypothetical protein